MWKSAGRVLAVLTCAGCLGVHAQQDDTAVRVQEALDTVNGDQYEKLVALGPEAVPAICDQLAVHKFPLVLVEALAEFQDDRATVPLLEFLQLHRDDEVLAQYTAMALKEIGDPRAEPALLGIVNDNSVHIATRWEATVALARLGTPDVKAWAWKEIMRIFRTGEGVSHNAHPNPDVILDRDVAKGLCEVLTEEADREIAQSLRYGNVNVGPLEKRAETRNRKWIVNAYLHLAEHEGKEEDGFEGRHTDYYQNVSALWFLHGLGGVIPTRKMLDIVEKLEKRRPELARPIEGEDQSLDQVITSFQRLKQSLLSELTVKIYRHPMTRKEELFNYLWCFHFQYASIGEYVSERDQPLLNAMLEDRACGAAWRNIPMTLGALGESPESFEAVKRYIQRKDSGIELPGVNLGSKIQALQWLPLLDKVKGSQLLVDILTSADAAEDFLTDWVAEETNPNHVLAGVYGRAFNGRIPKLRGSAALGLVLTDRDTYTPLVQREFDRAHEVVWANTISEFAEARGEDEHALHYMLCHELAKALAVAEYLAEHSPDAFWAIDWRERTFEPSKRADEIIAEASRARSAAGKQTISAPTQRAWALGGASARTARMQGWSASLKVARFANWSS